MDIQAAIAQMFAAKETAHDAHVQAKMDAFWRVVNAVEKVMNGERSPFNFEQGKRILTMACKEHNFPRNECYLSLQHDGYFVFMYKNDQSK